MLRKMAREDEEFRAQGWGRIFSPPRRLAKVALVRSDSRWVRREAGTNSVIKSRPHNRPHNVGPPVASHQESQLTAFTASACGSNQRLSHAFALNAGVPLLTDRSDEEFSN